MNQRAPKSRRDSGFTLVEIMVVIVIIGLIATIVGQNVIGSADDARISTTRASADQVKGAVELWYVKRARIPTLEELTTPNDRGQVELQGNVQDAWGNDFIIRELDGRGQFQVVSRGPDGIEDTEDDIIVPEPRDA